MHAVARRSSSQTDGSIHHWQPISLRSGLGKKGGRQSIVRRSCGGKAVIRCGGTPRRASTLAHRNWLDCALFRLNAGHNRWYHKRLHRSGAGAGAAARLLSLVYDELRRLAAAHLAGERPGHTPDATALVHEAYLRLVGDQQFEGRGHFFAAAAEAMRRILVNHARDRGRHKRGGGRSRVELLDRAAALPEDPDLVLSVDDLLGRLETEDATAARVAQLHLVGGLSVDDVADVLGLARATAYRNWKYARAWLRDALREKLEGP
ncbi:MAG: ECF-type sigma factor [Gemmataceae bacterium]